MVEFDFNSLEKDEAILARVLLKNHLMTEDVFGKYLEFRKHYEQEGKAYLGEVLKCMNYIRDEDLYEYLNETKNQHLKFLDRLEQDGYLMPEQKKMIIQKHNETGKDITTLLQDLKIMTRDTFSRIFNKRVHVLRLGDWLLINSRVTKGQLEEARKIQSANSLSDFLVLYGYLSETTLNKVKERISSLV